MIAISWHGIMAHYTKAAKASESLELYYTMIQFLNKMGYFLSRKRLLLFIMVDNYNNNNKVYYYSLSHTAVTWDVICITEVACDWCYFLLAETTIIT